MTITITDEEYQELMRVKREYDEVKNIFNCYTSLLKQAIIDVRENPASINEFLKALESLTR